MYNKDNVFYKILHQQIPADRVFENDVALAFYDINPVCKVHVLVICKALCCNFEEFVTLRSSTEVKEFFEAVAKVAEDILNLKNDGYRIVTNTGRNAGQQVEHFHVHILGGEKL